jgi:hypothetical protein
LMRFDYGNRVTAVLALLSALFAALFIVSALWIPPLL